MDGLIYQLYPTCYKASKPFMLGSKSTWLSKVMRCLKLAGQSGVETVTSRSRSYQHYITGKKRMGSVPSYPKLMGTCWKCP